MNPILEEFKKTGMDASYHFADDTGKEWGAGYQLKQVCYNLWHSHPELHDEMREVGKKFLFIWNPQPRTPEVQDAYEICDRLSQYTSTFDDKLGRANV